LCVLMLFSSNMSKNLLSSVASWRKRIFCNSAEVEIHPESNRILYHSI
jgi:hypothetical protein